MVPSRVSTRAVPSLPIDRTTHWILMGANRWLLTGTLLAVLFGTFVVLGALDPVPLRVAVATTDPIETLFQALLTAIIMGVTLVVTIAQLVLSQELGSIGDQRERMAGAMRFRREVESTLDRPDSPAEPAAFLKAIVDGAADQGERLTSTVHGGQPDQIRPFGAALHEQADSVGRRLATAEFGSFEVVRAALGFDYSSHLHRARELRHIVGDSDDEVRAVLDHVVETLELFAPAREHVKTLYFQWELIVLSRAVLYAAVPALAVTVPMILYVDDPGTITGATLGVDNLVWVASGSAAVALLPFMLLLSYILRITTVAKRTLAIGPFVLQQDGEPDG